jgi:acylglycerol lipase
VTGGGGASRRGSEGWHEMSDGCRVHWRRWAPAGRARGVVCLVHGLGDHCGRYEHVAGQLGEAGYATFGFDLRGFGRSAGRRGHLRFARALRDIDEMLARERPQTGGAPVFLYGHSLGGLLVLLYGLEYRPGLAGVVATGAALHTVLRDQPAKVLAARVLGAVAPGLTIPSGLDDTRLSRDPEVLRAYRADPLVHDRASLGFARDSLRAIDRVLQDAPRFTLPLLLVHGGADQLNLVSGSRAFAAAHPGDCTLRVYEGVLHAVEHEPERVQVVDDVICWMDQRLPPASSPAAARGRL